MQRVDVAEIGIAGILPAHPRGIGLGRPELLPDIGRRLENADRVAQTLRHLGLAIEAEDALGLREQRLRLGEVIRSATELRVPLATDFAGELEVLDLVLTDWYEMARRNIARKLVPREAQQRVKRIS